MLTGIFSYLTETTEEADRAFRFTVFLQVLQFSIIVFDPFSNWIYELLGYTCGYQTCTEMAILTVGLHASA